MRTLLVSLFFCAALSAQEYRGTFSGNVTDAQNAAIARVKIVATESRTGTNSETYSEASGAYTLPFLAPGEYILTAEAPGFKKFVRPGIALEMGQHPVIDIRLEIGAVSEAVTVTAEAPLFESANASVGQVITGEEVEDMPVNGRTPLMLGQLALGVIVTVEPGAQVRPFDNNPPGSFTMGGATSGTNELLYNGAPNMGFRNQMAYSPPQDAVQQVRVNAFESDASFGHTGGGTANKITKQGTNAFHGSASEFFQNSHLAANTFFNNARGVGRAIYNFHQYGVSGGGPVWIPKLVDGRNRVFWFFAWEGLQDSSPADSPRSTSNPTAFATVPTEAERRGDFSALLKCNAAGTDYSIYDPATGVVSGTRVARTPFPNNVIPTSRLNPVALNFLKFYPQPNTAGQCDGFRNYVVSVVNSNGYDNELARLDVNVSDRHKLFVDFRHSHRLSGTGRWGSNNFLSTPGTGLYLHRTNLGALLDDVYTITPTLVMNIRGNWTRFVETYTSPSDGTDLTELGFPSNIASTTPQPRLPAMVFTSTTVSAGSADSFQSLSTSANSSDISDIFQLFASVMKVSGNHTIKVGTDARAYRWSAASFGWSSGRYVFDSNWTRGPLSNSPISPLGQDFAAFLLGLPSSGQFDLNAQSTAGSKYFSFFLQDDWRARPTLTINAGLRIEYETPTTERFNRAVNGFDPTADNGIGAAAAAAYAAKPIPEVPAGSFNARGGPTFASPDDPGIHKTPARYFSPRLGFAWTPRRLGSRTVIRAGIGAFVVPIGIAGSGMTSDTTRLNQAGFSQTTQFFATGDNYLSPAATLSNPFPNGILQPAGSALGAGTFLGQSMTFFDPNILNPYNIRWTVGIQRQLPARMVLEAVYIGNHGVHLPITTQLDPIPRQYLSSSPMRDQATIDLLGGTVSNPFRGLLPNSASLNGASVARRQLLIPFPQYVVPGAPASTSNGVVMRGNNAGSSYFQSLNIRLQKRMTNGLTLISNFIYSKLIDRLVYLNDTDSQPSKRVSTDSRALREVLAFTYELPIGRGKPLDLRSRLGNLLVGGWKVNGNLVLQSGAVISPWGNLLYLGGPLNLQPHQPDGVAFDTTRFVTASSQQLAYNIRTFPVTFGTLRRDPSKNFDFSLAKDFRFGEGRLVQLRMEAFNATNRVTYGTPNITPTSTAFGTIGTQANAPRSVQLGARIVW